MTFYLFGEEKSHIIKSSIAIDGDSGPICTFLIQGTDLFLVNLKSTAEVYVDDLKVDPGMAVELKLGCRLRLGEDSYVLHETCPLKMRLPSVSKVVFATSAAITCFGIFIIFQFIYKESHNIKYFYPMLSGQPAPQRVKRKVVEIVKTETVAETAVDSVQAGPIPETSVDPIKTGPVADPNQDSEIVPAQQE